MVSAEISSTLTSTNQDLKEEENSCSLNKGIEEDVRPWLNLADDLRNLKIDQDLSIPMIAVMGDQSSGKSSVLEALSGVPLPRGSGLTTRCPLRLIMKKAPKDTPWCAKVYSTAKHSSTTSEKPLILSNPADITSTIESFTMNLTKSSNGFSTDSIVVELTSESAPDLTLIDLPGIVRTATKGQDRRVIEQVNAMIEGYLNQERTIILAVIPSNQDIATIDILERAQKVDPLGERTIGVLTKPDLIGPGGEDEAIAVLTNQRKPLKLGYTMVKNRSQKELNENLSQEKSRLAEEAFFRTSPKFGKLDPSLFGLNNLTTKLTNLLVNRVQYALIPMKNEVETSLAGLRSELKAMGTITEIKTPLDRQKLLVKLTQDYVHLLSDVIRGEYRDRLVVTNRELRLYTRVLDTFSTLVRDINESSPPFKDPSFVGDIAAQMEQFRGRELPGFMSAQAFYMFMASYAESWRKPGRSAIQSVRSIIIDVSNKIIDLIIVHYPKLKETFRSIVSTALDSLLENTEEQINDLIQQEKDPFTINDFLIQHINKIRYDRFEAAVEGGFRAVKSSTDSWDDVKGEVEEYMKEWYRTTHGVNSASNAEDMSVILEAYWLLSAKRYVDNACMVMDRSVLAVLPDRINEELYAFVNEDSKLQEYFEEDKEFAAKRDILQERIDRLVKAIGTMSKISVPAHIQQQVIQKKAAKLNANMKKLNLNASPGKSPGNQQNREMVSVKIQFYANAEQGLGIRLSSENDKIIVREFREFPYGQPNPGQQAGIQIGDILESVNGRVLGGNMDTAIPIIKQCHGLTTFTVSRPSQAN